MGSVYVYILFLILCTNQSSAPINPSPSSTIQLTAMNAIQAYPIILPYLETANENE